jgi:hypothetical protein
MDQVKGFSRLFTTAIKANSGPIIKNKSNTICISKKREYRLFKTGRFESKNLNTSGIPSDFGRLILRPKPASSGTSDVVGCLHKGDHFSQNMNFIQKITKPDNRSSKTD